MAHTASDQQVGAHPIQLVPAGTPAPPALPARWLQRFSRRLPVLVGDIVTAIVAEIPEYRDEPTGPVFAVARSSVQDAVRQFVTAVERSVRGDATLTSAGLPVVGDLTTFLELGRAEAMAGRSHDTLQSAYRIASRTVVRRLLEWERECPIPAARVAELSSAVFGYIDELADASARGYAEGLRDGGGLVARRNVLLGLLLAPDGASRSAARAWAQRLDWPIPEVATLVEVCGLGADLDVLAAVGEAVFGPGALAGSVGGRNYVVLPGRLSEQGDADVAERARAAGVAVVIGLPAPVERLDRAVRWVHAAATTPGSPSPVIRCADRLVDLLLDAGHDAHDALVRDALGPLLALSPAKRLKYGRLLSAWLELGGTHGNVPGVLDKHRQTIRYQMRRLEELFGDALVDREQRVRMLLALRVALPAWAATCASEGVGAGAATPAATVHG